jgi:AraC-like DNA-binding protein
MDIECRSFGSTRDLYVEYVKRSQPYTMQSDHFHSYYEIYYLLSGSRIYFVQDRTYRVEQGDLVFIGKNVLHKTLQTKEPGHERFIVHFDDAFLASRAGPRMELLREPFACGSPVVRLPRAEQRTVDGLVRRVVSEIRSKPPGYELVPPAAVTDLLLVVARYLREHAPLAASEDRSPKHAKISEVVRYLNGHYDEPLKLGEIAERFYVSPYHLSRTFKEVTGFAFSDYVILTRIKEAQRLLRETDLSVAEVAAASGFDNFSHFGKTFKRITRLSPREYRKRGG